MMFDDAYDDAYGYCGYYAFIPLYKFDYTF